MVDLDYICFNGYNGYSASARNNILALHQNLDYRLRITSLDLPINERITSGSYSIFNELSKTKSTNNQIQIYHCVPDQQRRVKRKIYSAGFGIFETIAPPDYWYDILNTNNAVLCPSMFTVKLFEKCDVPVHYVPHCIDPVIYNKDVEPLIKVEKFVFLFIGSWKERKGYRTLLKAWFDEFDEGDNVQLIIKTDKVISAEKDVSNIRNGREYTAPVTILNEIIGDTDIPKLMRSANCLVAPSLGEGFYLPGIQAMAVGTPVIVTGYSGPTDYANEETALLLEPEGFVKVPLLDNIPQFKDCSWAFISVKQLRDKMRVALENRELVQKKAEKAYKFVRENFSYQKTAESFDKALLDIPLTYKSLVTV